VLQLIVTSETTAGGVCGRNCGCEWRNGCSGNAEMKIGVYLKMRHNCVACMTFFKFM
jgi:hypothetical protein